MAFPSKNPDSPRLGAALLNLLSQGQFVTQARGCNKGPCVFALDLCSWWSSGGLTIWAYNLVARLGFPRPPAQKVHNQPESSLCFLCVPVLLSV